MDNAQKYLALESAARRATDAWLENDSAENHAAMCAADDALQAAKAAGWNMIQIAAPIVDEMMSRSVFGTADRQRAAAKADQAEAPVAKPAHVATTADLAIERGIVARIQAGALAELANLVDPAVDMPLYHDPEFLRAEILRITAGVRADIDAAKAERLQARRAA